MKKERILYIDRLRGINIVLVVMGHVITKNVVDPESSDILVWGYTFRMPLFMFLCGYVASKVITPRIFNNYTGFFLKKARTLLVPFFVWALLVKPFFFASSFNVNVLEILEGIVWHRKGLWFLWFLFWITLTYSGWLYMSYKFNNKSALLKDGLFFALIALFYGMVWYSGLVPFMKQLTFFLLFYFFGVFVARFLVFSTILSNKVIASLAFLIFVLTVGHYEYGQSFLQNTVVRLSCALAGITVFYCLIRNINFPPKLDAYVRYFGVHSLVIYVTHSSISHVFTHRFLSQDILPFYQFLITGALSILVAACCMLIYEILKHQNIVRFLLYGEKP